MLKNKKAKVKNEEKSKKKDEYNFLLYIPEIKHAHWELIDNKVVLYFKIKDPVKKFSGWLIRKSPTCDITFDELCTRAWLLIDGKRSIYDIAKEMASETNDSVDTSIYRVIPYIKHIAKKGWISFKEVKDLDSDKSNVKLVREY